MADEKTLRAAVAKDAKLKDLAGAWDAVAEVADRPGQEHPALHHAGRRRRLLHDLLRLCPDTGAGVRKSSPSPTKNGCRSSTIPTRSRWSSSYSPSRRFILISRSSNSPTRLTFLCEQLGYETKLVQQVLAGKSPRERAAELSLGTKLGDVKERKKLYEGGKKRRRGQQRPNDPAGQERRQRSSRGPQDHGGPGRGTQAASLRQNRQGQVRRRGDQHLSRRYFYAAAVVRHGQGIRRGRQAHSV